MALDINTFSNVKGGFPFFKAAGHPAVAPMAKAMVKRLAAMDSIAIYDPSGFAPAFGQLYGFDGLPIAHVFVQDLSALGQTVLGQPTQAVTDLTSTKTSALLVMAFDADKTVQDIAHLIPDGTEIVTLDEIRLPEDRLTNKKRYLDPLNFATNFAFFRDAPDGRGGKLHTRIATANYWHRYGASNVTLWLSLIDTQGDIIGQWDMALPDSPGGITIDSNDICARFGLQEITGQLFVHAIGVKGHDIVKYALDTYGDDPRDLSCTHDANAWPADFYGGLPAPKANERVLLWIQNSHPCPIPAGIVGLNLMGDDNTTWLDAPIPAFGTYALDAADLMPDAAWPEQIEVHAGKHFVRPRYEIETRRGGEISHRRTAHVNVERVDLEPNPKIAEIGNLMGKGFLLPAPVLPRAQFRSIALPTPMATTQETLPVAVLVYDRTGREITRHSFGELQRRDSVALDLDDLLNGEAALDTEAGHMELLYDFGVATRGVDGWLHALFRYEARASGHAAETSFGAHIFNTALTWQGEPQSYSGVAPGLSTRLFLRTDPSMAVGENDNDTFCQLIYPISTPWHPKSETQLMLHDGAGNIVAETVVEIDCGGSFHFRLSELFDAAARKEAAKAGAAGSGYVLIRDTTCRLFGYHGVISHDGSAFSLDHMFGF
ncbi:MAG: hypothetical protein OSB67_08870 [Alphaproteobacteria bacterium]|nr:hypothetical protein [Alphaproteobacteria bacterium]